MMHTTQHGHAHGIWGARGSAMMVFYALEERSAAFVLAFAGACLAASVYGFLQGAWPFGIVEIVWSGAALRRWTRRRSGRGKPPARIFRSAS